MDVPAIITENLTREFGSLVAVNEINLRVDAGQFFGFLGPNAHSAANEWVAALAQRLRDVET